MSEPFIGQIVMFGGNFAPRSWAFCDGQLLPISQNQALFSILGTTFGGDGRTTFGLPDLRGRVPLHPGSGPGLTTRRLGEKRGDETVTLTTNQIPSHTHTLRAKAGPGSTINPASASLAADASGVAAGYTSAAPDADMSSQSILNTGGSQSHQTMPPFLGVNFIIALVGIFPSRS
jgi:microcystin-dependent protein